jgi:hypothetical protein
MPKFTKFELFYTPRFPFFFLAGMLLLAVMGNMLTDLLKNAFGDGPWRLAMIFSVNGVALALLVAAAHAAGAIQKRLSKAQTYSVEGKRPERCKGLIAFVSLQQRGHLETALAYHSGKLEHVWLVATKDSKALAHEIRTEYEAEGTNLSIHIVDLDDQWNLASAKTAVERIYGEKLDGLEEEDVIADFTGGTKPMTAGMIFACMRPPRKLQYVPADYRSGDPKPLEPIEYGLDSIREPA